MYLGGGRETGNLFGVALADLLVMQKFQLGFDIAKNCQGLQLYMVFRLLITDHENPPLTAIL